MESWSIVCKEVDINHARHLLPLCLYMPTTEKTEALLSKYLDDSDKTLYLYKAGKNGVPVGVIGFHNQGNGISEILHIAVDTDYRGHGIGRTMISEAVNQLGYISLVAQTDKDAIDFYRSCGFHIRSLGMLNSETQRFLCTWKINVLQEGEREL